MTRTAIEAALARSDIAEAATLAERALAAGVVDPLLLNLAAWRAEEAGDLAAAQRSIDRALALAPDDAAIVCAAGRLQRLAGDVAGALARFDAASRLDPGFAVPWLERGQALEASGATAAARASYTHAADLDPGLAPAFAGAAAMAAREGDGAAVDALAARALALDPGEPVATCALATRAIEAGDAVGAAARLDALLARPLGAEDRIAALTLLGDARDRLDQPAAAFAAYADAKARFAAHHAPRFPPGEPSQRAWVDGLTAAVTAVDPAAWHVRVVPPAKRGHVFLLGYPRSGTTLVENILASAPNVDALEEQPTTLDADHAFLTDPDGIARLAALDSAGAARFVAAYWDRVAAAGIGPATTFVDMDPLRSIKLPLIAKLFPDAKVVVMRRDPRDVVWSCFRQNFRLSAAAYAFTTLDEIARHYAAVMALTETCLAALPIAAHVVRYDALVADFDTTTRAICAFTGIDWSPALRRFDRTAVTRGVATASAGQVRRGLFDGGGQWRRYAAPLAPVMPILAPWLDQFGFERDIAPGDPPA